VCGKKELECIPVFSDLIIQKKGNKLEVYDEWVRRFPCIKTCKRLAAHVLGMIADGKMLMEAIQSIDLYSIEADELLEI